MIFTSVITIINIKKILFYINYNYNILFFLGFDETKSRLLRILDQIKYLLFYFSFKI